MTARITVLGLGTGDPDQLTLGCFRKLQQADKLYLRTDQHPMIEILNENQIAYESFDQLYVEKATFEEVYEEIAQALIRYALADNVEIVYAVPGHPMVAEFTVVRLRELCSEANVELQIMGGESFLDQAFTRFGFDPIDGFQLLDATDLKLNQLNPNMHTIIGQVYDTFTASDVKLSLMERYPDDYNVVVGHALGVQGAEQMIEVPLYELDQIEGYGNLSLVWVPRGESPELLNRTFERLHEIVSILRSPEGCPWDREQTHASLRKNLIEETYEVLETIDDDDPDAMCEEMGDLLLQVMLHSQIEEETGVFTVYDVIETLNEKLIRRHPHVFGEREAGNSDEALANWQAVKDEEKRSKGIDLSEQSLLDGIPRELPSLMKSLKLQKKAATVGFDWPNSGEVIDKIVEELDEVREAIKLKSADNQHEELGDLLFAVVNLARMLKVDPESAIAAANRKFTERFQYIEQGLKKREKDFAQSNLEEMESLWQEAKKVLKKQAKKQEFS
ncbi:nucleoside triphosphate pyrophosphohydrolase [Paenibacillus albiflavus]|uniref:Nucleoside triphosphate pyrophosphohydrolase n=1 Tax=Paenibacillus albiflavus TaxID=2545760 RepID=A0A4R4E959_9BACL|nr:nucleoside triphosphate pyrophosphohydrolase [Paenibacillus albiflavus]TCZ74325.1 nucleoside triphosphate pyrophosphohydrolase [Paenibacillus albiflavus]